MNPCVSVVMTTYNRAKILPRAVSSVLNQDYNNIELIIVNDKSDDDTLDVIKKLQKQDDRINFINRQISAAEEQKNGQYAVEPANDGLKIAKGKYISHLDDDDLFCKGKIRVGVDFLENNSLIGLVYGDFILCDIDSNRKEIIGATNRKDVDYDYLLKYGNYFGNMEVMYRRAIYEDIGKWSFDISGGRDKRMGRIGADYNYWLKIAKKYSIKYLPFIMGVTIDREHPDYWNPNIEAEDLSMRIKSCMN